MPAPLAKGPGRRSSSPQSHPPTPPSRPNHPLQTGLIIAASVIVAAGIAIYESPQVRQWVDQSRRKIATALHSLGDDIHPRRPSECSDDFEARQQRREELIRRNRNELIRRAREEGIAVDLDELAQIGRDETEMVQRRQRRQTNASSRSFDDLVSSDGTLKKEDVTAKTATGTESIDTGLRKRGAPGFEAGPVIASPFTDDNQVLFDHDTAEEAPSPKPFTYIETRESSATIEGNHPASPSSDRLIDLTPEPADASAPFNPEPSQPIEIPHAEAEEHNAAAQSFYSFTSSSSHNSSHVDLYHVAEHEHDDIEKISAGTLTPRSEHSAFTGASVVGSHADDIGVLSMQHDDDHDARSEIFSEGGFTDAGFSEVSENRLGAITPASWTDVGSDDESEWGGPAQGGQVSQVHQ